MNSSELRLGNIFGVSWLDDKSPSQEIHCVVKSITTEKIEASVFSFEQKINNHTSYKISECVGMPLTEDWLIKLGFRVFPWGWVKLTNSEEGIGVLIKFYTKPKLRAWLEVGNGLTAEFTCVHQLQNLYFALTGIELS